MCILCTGAGKHVIEHMHNEQQQHHKNGSDASKKKMNSSHNTGDGA